MRTELFRALTGLGVACGGLLALATCTVPAGDLSGKTCSIQEDCPRPYACVLARPGALKTCELLVSPQTYDASEPLDGGGVYYCSDVKPILDTYCVTCHGPTQQNGGDFRLDWYSRDGGTLGASDMADLIKLRAYDTRTMPPPTAAAFPLDEDRLSLAIWAVAGAPFCDGGVGP